MRAVTVALIISITGVLAMTAFAADGPEYGGRYTKERIANLRANIEEYDWAAARRDSMVSQAEWWVNRSNDELWEMIPGQTIGRTIDTTMTNKRPGVEEVRIHKCPVCGDDITKHGNYPWIVDSKDRPWKIKCPSCGTVFPTNDFEAYWRSGRDETGVFDPERADKSLLYNTEHPDPDDPKHTWGVDDGYGWTDEEGIEHRFIGYFAWRYWGFLKGGLGALCQAYLYTGDSKYAHKAGVMFDRIADLYPDMDFSEYGLKRGWYHSCGGSGRGKIEGRIWEASTVRKWGQYYDMVRSGLYGRPELYAFLAKKGEEYDLPTEKGTYECLRDNIETNAVQEGVKAVFEGDVRTNEGGNQLSVLHCAIALNRDPLTAEWIDWIFHEGKAGTGEGGHIPQLIVGEIDRDGVGAEGAPGYALGWSVRMGVIANLLSDYAGSTKYDLYRDFPRVKKSVMAAWRLAILGKNTPNIGDAGKTGSRGIARLNPREMIETYKRLKDPELALAAVRANNGRYEGLGRDIFAEDPDWVEQEIADLLAKHGVEPKIEGENLSGYGLVSCEFGPPDTGHGLWMYYGRNGGHAHRDRLNFGLDAYGLCMSPDLGYPEFATKWPKRNQWTDNTISHNTVIINETPQSTNWVGHPQFFAQFEDFGGFCVQSPGVYPNTAEKYERTMALVKVGPQQAYALDIFRVAGGADHLMSFHGLEADVTAEGLNLTKQDGGSYAGPDVEFKDSPWKGPKTGYAWLDNVERDEDPPDAFMLDYGGAPGYRGLREGDDIHLRYHFLSQVDDIALCDGHPPSNKSGNPESLRYLMAHRRGDEGLESTFAAVIEPFRKNPLIESVTRLQINNADPGIAPVALRIELADGRTDYLLSGPDDETVYETEDGISFSGRLIGLRTRDGSIDSIWMIRAGSVQMGRFTLSPKEPGYRGIISKMDKDMEGDGHIWVENALPTDDTLRGTEIIIENDRRRNAVYTIQDVQKDGELWRINCGEVSFIRSFKDPMNYEAGYVYNFEEGAEWIIPNTIRLERHGDSLIHTRTNTAVDLQADQGG